jgi:tetratricopeptide (TPR) repeat protein
MSESLEEILERGYLARRESRTADARAAFIDAVRHAAEAKNPEYLAEALCGLGQAERDIENIDAARHHYSLAEELYRKNGPPERLAYALRHLADVEREACLPVEAEPRYVEAESIYRQAGETHRLDLANTLRGLALVTDSQGAGSKAQPLWREARELYAELNVKEGVAECDKSLAR